MVFAIYARQRAVGVVHHSRVVVKTRSTPLKMTAHYDSPCGGGQFGVIFRGLTLQRLCQFKSVNVFSLTEIGSVVQFAQHN